MNYRFAAAALVILAIATGVYLAVSYRSPQENGQTTIQNNVPFAEDGYLTKVSPETAPDLWRLVYEKPGAPALTMQLQFGPDVKPALKNGERVHVEGSLIGSSTVSVTSITSIQAEEQGLHIKLYYYNPLMDQGPGRVQCSDKGLVPVERVIPPSKSALSDTIKILLRGEISEEEKAQGVTSEFPLPGVALKSAVVENGIATLTFADPEHKLSGGSCRVAILWNQIEATAKQFPEVTSVTFLPEDIFQP